MKIKNFGTGSGGSTAWIFQRITGLVIVVTIFLHYLFLHFLNGGMVTFGEVSQRLSTPLWKTIDITFLTAIIYHSIQGVIMNIHDYVHRAGIRVTLVGLTWFVFIVLWITGITTVINFRPY
ncbi:succinate dehydrogenase, hydrophobic membrane anchor protein [Calditrichota bacterium]